MRPRLYHLALVLFAVAVPLRAHDMWIEPAAFRTTTGGRVPLRLFLGEAFRPEETIPPVMDRVSRLESHGPQGTRKESSPSIETIEAGTYVVVMERIAAAIELDAQKFNSYLEEEGHHDAVRDRMKRGEYGKPARERYTRHLKTIIQAGDRRMAPAHVFGTTLEIVPRSIGPTLDLQVLFEGKPLSGARLGIVFRGDDGKLTRERFARTDSRGRAEFTLDATGGVFVRTTHIRRCRSCSDADYESFWSALTFHNDQSTAKPSP
jgi:uncharacterized GH25 family protein